MDGGKHKITTETGFFKGFYLVFTNLIGRKSISGAQAMPVASITNERVTCAKDS